MRCNDIAAIMDEHRTARLTAAERNTVDAHLSTCADCAAAWHADTELLALRLPPTPAALLDRVVTGTSPSARPRRVRAPLVIASALLAGAALAAVTATTIVTVRRAAEHSASTTTPAPVGEAAVTSDAQLPGAAAPLPQAERRTSAELVEVAMDMLPASRKPPDYPKGALEQRVEGWVQIQFDVTATGTVENVRVIDSSDPQFEAATMRAVSSWRYLPRVVAGKRVASTDIQTIIRFQLEAEPTTRPSSAELQASDESAREAARAYAEFAADMDVALDRFGADDLRGAELQLDEMYAIYDNDGRRGAIWHFYGYLYTVQGNYDRAIEAYESGIAAYTRAGSPEQGRWVPLANLYFARHQYDVALDKLLTYKAQHALARERRGLEPGQPNETVEAFIERLRALGVTEETLPPNR